jgi:sulfatase modifying factor 1
MKQRTAYLVAMMAIWSFPTAGSGQAAAGRVEEMVRIPAGSYLPHYARDNQRVEVEPFVIDRNPVTREQFASFLEARPNWRRGAVKPIFAARGYLRSWPGAADFGGNAAAALPVTEVSWFAAKSYCGWRGARLPTLDEWEYVASASETSRDASRDPGFIQRLLEITTVRSPNPRSIGSTFRNAYGVEDMHGLVSEWVLDFNSIQVAGDSRTGTPHDAQLYCAAGSLHATDPNNYPAFLRFAMRGGMEASSTLGNVGFRCASSP